jgi:hypothetical protein
VIPKPLATSWTTSATKAGPLSDPIDTGIPNQGMISFNRKDLFSFMWGRLPLILRRYKQTPTDIYILKLVAFQ